MNKNNFLLILSVHTSLIELSSNSLLRRAQISMHHGELTFLASSKTTLGMSTFVSWNRKIKNATINSPA
jgi:hypothetical protein